VMWEMGQRLADGGYLVLLPDLYYRLGSYPPMVPAEVLADPKRREELMRFVNSLDRHRKIADAGAFIEFLSSRSEVKGKRFGATGYCMGGNASLTATGAYPDRFAAAASFHGGNLATDKPDSPHLFLGKVTGRIYVAGAVEDSSFTDEQKSRLEQTLGDAGVDHLIETYPARHGLPCRICLSMTRVQPSATGKRPSNSSARRFRDLGRHPDAPALAASAAAP